MELGKYSSMEMSLEEPDVFREENLQGRTYDYFINLYDLPYIVVSLAYVLALFLVSIAVAASKVIKCHRNCSVGGRVMWWVTRFNTWLVNFLLGKQHPGTSQGTGGSGDIPIEADKDRDTVVRVHIQGYKMDDQDINILGIIIICFGLLMAIAAFDVFLLETSENCSEDPATSCYLDFINPGDHSNPNITDEEFIYPIVDCSKWEDPDIVDLVAFQRPWLQQVVCSPYSQ
jgi:hypothetical protein